MKGKMQAAVKRKWDAGEKASIPLDKGAAGDFSKKSMKKEKRSCILLENVL